MSLPESVAGVRLAFLAHWQEWRMTFATWRKYRRAMREKFIWKCYRYHGGAVLQTPRPMTEDQATAWLSRVIKGDVAYIDRNYHFLFYRPRE